MNQKKSKQERRGSTTMKSKPDKANVISNVVIGAVIVAFLGLGGYAVTMKAIENKKNAPVENEVVQQQPQTVKDYADLEGVSVSEFLEKYGLDAAMDEDTTIADAANQMTLENFAEFNKTDVDTFRQENFVPENITNDTKWSDIENELPFKAIVGEEQVSQMKEIYGLGDEITADTKWGEVEPILQAKAQEMNAAMSNAEAANTETEETNTKNTAETEETQETNTENAQVTE